MIDHLTGRRTTHDPASTPSPPAAATTTTWTTAVADYTSWCTAAGVSARSLRIRRHYLRHVAQLQPDPWAATLDDLVRFLAVPGWAPETRKSARGAVRSFYRWATVTGRIPADPAVALPPVRVPSGRPRPAPDLILQAALERADRRAG